MIAQAFSLLVTPSGGSILLPYLTEAGFLARTTNFKKWDAPSGKRIYEALQDTRLQRRKLMRLYIEQMPPQGRIVLGVVKSSW